MEQRIHGCATVVLLGGFRKFFRRADLHKVAVGGVVIHARNGDLAGLEQRGRRSFIERSHAPIRDQASGDGTRCETANGIALEARNQWIEV